MTGPAAIVITGGAGFVGQHLIHELAAAWPATRLVVWDRQAGPAPAEYAVVDITQPATYAGRLRELAPAWVVHLAAVAQVSTAIADPAHARRVNVTATQELLTYVVAESPATRVLAVSSAEIYGRAAAAPLAELSAADSAPLNPYGESKREMEAMIAASFAERCLIVRPFPHIGPGQGTGFVTADFASQIAALESQAAQNSQEVAAPILKVGNLTARRDFTDVRDVVRAYRLLMEYGSLGEVYHVASGVAVVIREVLDRLLALSTVRITVEQDPARLRPADTPVLVGDASKLRRLTGWQPEITLDQSLADILQWWREKEGLVTSNS